MLADPMNLEALLDNLFGEDGTAGEDLVILKIGVSPTSTYSGCCTFNYATFGG